MKVEFEIATKPQVRLHWTWPAKLFTDEFADMESEANAFGADLLASVKVNSVQEEIVLVFLCKTRAWILHLNFDFSKLPYFFIERYIDIYETIFGCKLQGITLKDQEHLLQTLFICTDRVI